MSDRIPETLFELIRGRASSPSDRRRLVAIKAALELSDTDEIWPILIAFDHHGQIVLHASRHVQKCMEDFPRQVTQSFKTSQIRLQADLKTTIDSVMMGHLQNFRQIGVTREEEARESGHKEAIMMVIVGMFLTIAAALLAGGAMYFYLKSEVGICSATKQETQNGVLVCIVE